MDSNTMAEWIGAYLEREAKLLGSLPVDTIAGWVEHLREAHREGRQVFVCGNGGNAASASHFVTDLGKGASNALGKPFRVLSLNTNTPWLTAIGNDFDFADVFRRQLENYARRGDLLIASSVSGSSPNLLEAFSWARTNGLKTLAITGTRRGELADLAEEAIVIDDEHYGRVEDLQMVIYHLLSFAFMDNP